MKAKHPDQPVETDSTGVIRFKPNAIVRHLVNNTPGFLNQLDAMKFSREDRQQLAQLLGYSVSGYCGLPYTKGKASARAWEQRNKLLLAEK